MRIQTKSLMAVIELGDGCRRAWRDGAPADRASPLRCLAVTQRGAWCVLYSDNCRTPTASLNA
jgi:hypothetical protein